MKDYDYQTGDNSLHVDARFAIYLADNGECADARVCLMAAPAIGDGNNGLAARSIPSA